MFDDILKFVSAVGDVAKSGNEVVSFINNVKKLLKNEQSTSFNTSSAAMPPHVPQMGLFNANTPNYYGQGNQWLSNLQMIASQHGDPWVPTETQPFAGINLTGVWVIPTIMSYEVFVRQYGPYLNMVGLYAGMAVVFAEGIFDPTNRIIHSVGQNTYYGIPFETRGQLFPNWTVQGIMTSTDQWGRPSQMPFSMQKVS